jgi:hypothetical protein
MDPPFGPADAPDARVGVPPATEKIMGAMCEPDIIDASGGTTMNVRLARP